MKRWPSASIKLQPRKVADELEMIVSSSPDDTLPELPVCITIVKRGAKRRLLTCWLRREDRDALLEVLQQMKELD